VLAQNKTSVVNIRPARDPAPDRQSGSSRENHKKASRPTAPAVEPVESVQVVAYFLSILCQQYAVIVSPHSSRFPQESVNFKAFLLSPCYTILIG
jgi:hypothetical protein